MTLEDHFKALNTPRLGVSHGSLSQATVRDGQFLSRYIALEAAPKSITERKFDCILASQGCFGHLTCATP